MEERHPLLVRLEGRIYRTLWIPGTGIVAIPTTLSDLPDLAIAAQRAMVGFPRLYAAASLKPGWWR